MLAKSPKKRAKGVSENGRSGAGEPLVDVEAEKQNGAGRAVLLLLGDPPCGAGGLTVEAPDRAEDALEAVRVLQDR